MPECDGFFNQNNVPFQPEAEDQAVHVAWRLWYSDPHYAKFLIQCWFDTTYRDQRPTEQHRSYARTRMSLYLKSTPYATFEELLTVQPRRNDGDDESDI